MRGTPPISQPPPAHHRPSTHPSITSNTSCLSHCDRVNSERLIMQQTFNQIALARETLESRSTDHMEHRPRLSRSLTGVRRLRSDGMSIHPEHSQLQTFSFFPRVSLHQRRPLSCNHGYRVLIRSLHRILDRSILPTFNLFSILRRC